jgi:hypothetical protein
MDRWDLVPGAGLFKSEILLFSCDQVGLYNENERMLIYDNGTITLTNQRIIWKSINGEPILSLSLGLIDNFSLNVGQQMLLAYDM